MILITMVLGVEGGIIYLPNLFWRAYRTSSGQGAERLQAVQLVGPEGKELRFQM